jgi:hypothetical protein
MNTSSNGRFLSSSINHSLTHPLRETASQSLYSQDDDSLSSATSTTRGRRRFRRIRSQQPRLPPSNTQTATTTHDVVDDSIQSLRRKEWISTGISEVAIRIKDEPTSRPPIVSVSDQALYKENDEISIEDSEESSISSMSSYGDITIKTDHTLLESATEIGDQWKGIDEEKSRV